MGAFTQPIVLIVVGILIGWLGAKICTGTIAKIVAVLGTIVTIIGIVLLVMALL